MKLQIPENTPAYREQERFRPKIETTSDALLIHFRGVQSQVAAYLGVRPECVRRNQARTKNVVPAYIVADGHVYLLKGKMTNGNN